MLQVPTFVTSLMNADSAGVKEVDTRCIRDEKDNAIIILFFVLCYLITVEDAYFLIS